MINDENLPIRDRILNALEDLEENRLRPGKHPQAPGVHNTTIKRLIDRESLPGVKNLAAICRATNKSADYFIFGKEPALATGEAAAKLYDARPLPDLNEVLLIQVVATVEEYLLREKRKIYPTHKGRLIAALYDICQKDKTLPDSQMVENNWDLVR